MKLTRNSQRRSPTIEVIDWIFGIGRDGKDLTSAFGIVRGDFRSVDINEAVVLEEGMNGHRQNRTNPIKGIEGVGSRAEISFVTEIFEGRAFLLQRIIIGNATQKRDGSLVNLEGLLHPRSHDDVAFDFDGGT